MPIYDIISHLAYVTDAQDVISVIVDGKVLMREQEVLTIDKNRVRKQARAIAAKIQEYLRKKGTEKKAHCAFLYTITVSYPGFENLNVPYFLIHMEFADA